MKPEDIVVGGKYSNETEKYRGVRIVDVILERRSGQTAVVWRNALRKSVSHGHSHGVSTLATFSRWSRKRGSAGIHVIQRRNALNSLN